MFHPNPLKSVLVAVLALAAGAFVADAALKGPGHKKTFRALAETDMAQMQAGRIAQQKSTNPVVRTFAQQMVQDHTQMLSSTRFVASQQHIDLPTAISSDREAEISRLQGLSGKDFDMAYIQNLARDSERSAKMLPRGEPRSHNPAVSSYMQKTQAALQDHIRAAQHVAGQLGTPAQARSAQPENTANAARDRGDSPSRNSDRQ